VRRIPADVVKDWVARLLTNQTWTHCARIPFQKSLATRKGLRLVDWTITRIPSTRWEFYQETWEDGYGNYLHFPGPVRVFVQKNTGELPLQTLWGLGNYVCTSWRTPHRDATTKVRVVMASQAEELVLHRGPWDHPCSILRDPYSTVPWHPRIGKRQFIFIKWLDF
jgi:hypothetical protein